MNGESSLKLSFLGELQRRNVHRAAVFYAGAAWLLVQIATQVFPFFDIPNATVRVAVIAALIGLPFALLFSWFYEWTPQGIRRESEIDRSQSITQSTGKKLDKAIIAVLALAVLVLLLNQFVLHRFMSNSETVAAGDKSIAVLPFENLSDDHANAYFATGIQDEILTRLAKIGALKVISRTSTQHYASSPDNLPEIARQLGVANILEGSVQKIGDAVHINVQLIRAATDAHLWAESYDRKLDNIFGVEGEVAGTIAAQLDARLTGAEQQALARKPTENAAAYDAYLRAVALSTDYGESLDYYQSLADLFNQAVTADPGFAEAWAQLSLARTEIYFVSGRKPAELAAAKGAADAALKLQPELPLAWMALGYYRYWGEHDYAGALEAYEHARQQLPHDAKLEELTGLVERRQGRWEESLVQLQKAAQLDPRDSEIWANIGFSNEALRRFAEARAAYQKGLDLQPGNETIIGAMAQSYLDEGNTDAAAKRLTDVRLDPKEPRIAAAYTELWRQQRAYDQGIAAWSRVLDQDASPNDDLDLAFAYVWRGGLALCAGNHDRVLKDFTAARTRLETMLRLGNTNPQISGFLGGAYAALGDRTAALEASRRGFQSIAYDAFSRADARIGLAVVEVWAGDPDSAIAELKTSLREPGGVGVAQLEQDCQWDPLRSDARFQPLIADAKAAMQARSGPP